MVRGTVDESTKCVADEIQTKDFIKFISFVAILYIGMDLTDLSYEKICD